MSYPINLGPVRILVEKRADETSFDYWDGNWMHAQIYHERSSRTLASGAILHLTELKDFLRDLEHRLRLGSGSAELHCMEPYLQIVILIENGEAGKAEVRITPASEAEPTLTNVDLTVSEIQSIIQELKELLEDYPLRGNPNS